MTKNLSEEKPSKLKKVIKILLCILLGIICLVIVAFLLATIINKNITKKNVAKYEGFYGEYYETANGRINYSIIGEGEETIVILPGLGSVSPYYEFTEVIDYLDDNYKVIVVEPLGYGLSDETKVDRTADNVCAEIHEVLSGIGEEKYYIMGHSIAGLYSLNYCNLYEEEVLGFIGIDASLPAQINDDDPSKQYAVTKLMRMFMVDSGLYRVVYGGLVNAPDEEFDNPAVQGNPVVAFKYLAQEDKELYSELYSSKTANNTVTNELKCLRKNCEEKMGYTFPDTIPVLYVLAQDTVDSDPNWAPHHQDLAQNNDKSEVIIMEGSHYLHICDANKLCDIVIKWLEENT